MGNLSVTLNGAGSRTILGTQNNAAAGASPQFTFKRSLLNPGQYTSVAATWDDLSVSIPVSFKVIGPTRFSTYNVPIESSCSGKSTPVWVFENDIKSRLFYQGTIASDFYVAIDTNGTGLSNSYGLIKPYDTTWLAQYCPLPTAVGATHGRRGNTFVRVGSQISDTTGARSSKLAFGNSLATSPDPNTGTQSWSCNDNVLLVNPSNDQTDSTKVVQDCCPACSGDFRGQTAHIDTFSPYQTCSDHSASDYGNYTAIRLK